MYICTSELCDTLLVLVLKCEAWKAIALFYTDMLLLSKAFFRPVTPIRTSLWSKHYSRFLMNLSILCIIMFYKLISVLTCLTGPLN